jgi:hypothetical protein
VAVLVASRSARLWLAVTLKTGQTDFWAAAAFVDAVKIGWRF